MIEGRMQAMYDALEKSMFVALIALFKAIHKFFSMPGKFEFAITFEKPIGDTVTQKWQSVKKKGFVKLIVKDGDFELQGSKGRRASSLKLSLQDFDTKLPVWFTKHLGKKISHACKNKSIWVYYTMNPGIIGLMVGAQAAMSLMSDIPAAIANIDDKMFDVVIPFGAATMTFTNNVAIPSSPPPPQEIPINNTFVEESRRRRTINDVPIFSTLNSQLLLSTGDLDRCIARRREMIQRNLAAGGKKTKGRRVVGPKRKK